MYFYRKDLFADAKNQADFKAKYGYDLAPPATWDQLADIDEFFYRPPDLYGGWMSGVNWGIGLDYQTILFGVGGRAFDLKANALLANSPESVKTSRSCSASPRRRRRALPRRASSTPTR
jgi:multiple sugar transport system substrate-binding protein